MLRAESNADDLRRAIKTAQDESSSMRIVQVYAEEEDVENILLVSGNPPYIVASNNNKWKNHELANYSDHFDLIFLDCQMPEMDGYTATKKICHYESMSNSDNIPIIAFTANSMQGDREKCISAGIDDYITKPVSRNALKKLLYWLPETSIEFCYNEERANINEQQEDAVEDVAESEKVNEDDKQVEEDVYINYDTINRLRKLFGEEFEDFILQYKTATEKNLDTARQAMAANDNETLVRTFHSLKSSSRQIGAMQLGNIAEEAENLAKNSLYNDIRQSMIELRAHYEELLRRIKDSDGEVAA